MQTRSPSNPSEDSWKHLQERLDGLRVKRRRVAAVSGLLILGAAILMAVLFSGGTEALFRFSPAPRLVLLSFCLVVLFAIAARYCISPYLKKPSDDQLARRVDRHYPDLFDRVTMTLQLWRQRESASAPGAEGLLEAAIVSSAAATEHADFNDADGRERIPKAGRLLGLSALILCLALALFYSPLISAFERISHPLTHYPVPQRTFLSVIPGDFEIPAGGSVTIAATVSGEMPDDAFVHLTRKDGEEEQHTLTRDTGSTFSLTLRALNQDIQYLVEAGDALSGRFTITVVDRPTIASLNLTYEYPSYTKMAPRTTADGTGDIIAIKGTNVTLDVRASQPIEQAQVVMAGTKETFPMAVSGSHALTALKITQNDRYSIQLRNENDRSNATPPQYQITALSDRLPEVRIISPGQDTDLNENMMIPLVLAASDDFGFSSMNLVYQDTDGGATRRKYIPVDQRVRTFSVPFVWDLSNLGLFPEDVLSYYVEIYDNDAISGPKLAVSQTYTVRFPSITEIYEELDAQQGEHVADITELLQRQEAAEEQLKDLNRELEQSESSQEPSDLSWEQKKEAEALVKEQEQMAEAVLKVADAMQEAMEQVEQQNVMDPELLEQMNQLREMFQEIATPELMEAMKDVKEAMQNPDEQQMAEAMKDFEKAQEEFKKRLERSLSILKRMRAEQQMESAVKKAQELLERQEELQYATQNDSENPSSEARESLSEKQAELSKDTQAMQKDLQELAESMEAVQGEMPQEEIQDAARSMEQQAISQQMQQISQQLAKGQMKQAQQGQEQTGEQLSKLSQQLQDAQSQMQQEQQEQIAAEMRQAMHTLVDLSQGQEALKTRTAQPSGRESRLDDIAEDQQSLSNGTAQVADALVGTSQKTFFVSPEVGRSLGESLNRMQDASRGISERNRGTAAEQQAEAMASLNQTVLSLQQAMNDMNASGSSSGMMEMLQQLQSMSQQQSGVNDELNQMMQQQQGKGEGQSGQQKLSMEERSRMSRLAQQQEQIRKSLEQMQREQRQQADVLGRLSEIEREMKESVKQLTQQQMAPELVERQQRILSRLLDASKSMRERDYKDERKATSGEDLAGRPSPNELPPGLLQFNQPLREDLLRSARDGTYPSEYEDLIRAYFRALAEEPRDNTSTK
ncbi:MAG: hypothetical protein HOH43_21330 [Candidatus Latescibacteria bacterium]|nr:hypothetical protein [Candidatus Latescibacterota bacterium]